MGLFRRLWKLLFGAKDSSSHYPESSSVNIVQNKKQKSNKPVGNNSCHTPIPIKLDTSFYISYNDSLGITIRNYTPVQSSESVMPSTFVPTFPSLKLGNMTSSTSSLIVTTFTPAKARTPITTIALALERKEKENLFRASFKQQLQEAETLLLRKDFEGSYEIACKLVEKVSGISKRADLLSDASIMVTKVTTAQALFMKEEKERIRREQEETELRRIERERQDKKQTLFDTLEKMIRLANTSDWVNASKLRDYLINEIPKFGDKSLSDKLKEVLFTYESILSSYRIRIEQIRKEEEAQKEKERREAQERKEQKLRKEAKELLTDFWEAAQKRQLSTCITLKEKLDNAVSLLNDALLKESYQRAIKLLNLRQKEYQDQQRKEAEQRQREEQERHILAQKQAEEFAKKAEKARVLDLTSRYGYILVQLLGEGKCFCLHRYYPKNRYNNVSDEDQKIRELIYCFKNKFHNKTQIQIDWARSVFCDEVTTLLHRFYEDNLSDIWFCTAQASTPESAEQRFKFFCEKVSNACGVKNGFDLIKVIGTKLSASTEGGVRGDISNLSIDSSVRGKKIVLFDDIITSGQSLSNLRKAILTKGATWVDCIAFGKTV